ncbi:DUF6207 family protein [Streptomyces sp. NPDC096311]
MAAADDQTAFAPQEVLATRWATATADVRHARPASPAYGCAATALTA